MKIGRPRYSDLENGKRDVSLRELEAFAGFFNRPLEYFLAVDPAAGKSFQVLFRKTEGCQATQKIVAAFENLCLKMHSLEQLLDQSPAPIPAPDYPYDADRLGYSAATCSGKERRRLDLGISPIRDLEGLLEDRCGIKIFYLPIPVESGISGMFTYDENLGGCILLNSADRPVRRLFSLAHEYGHCLFHRNRIGMVSLEEKKDTADERIANYFAGNFLMPRDAVEELFDRKTLKKQEITAEDVLYISEYFGVSFQAMLYRLANLRKIPDDTKCRLEGASIDNLRRAMGLEEVVEDTRPFPRFPRLYVKQCFKAYSTGRITTHKLAEYLEIPLYEAMAISGRLRGSSPG